VKRATLERDESTDEGTFGVLRLDGQVLRTTELPWRENRAGVSCIPPGVYRCELVNSPRFGRVYGVRDVAGRQNILIHAANFGGDKAQGWHTELQGCIAPAMSVGVLKNPNGVAQLAGLQSKAALAEFMAWAGGVPFELEVR
jgi:hypothetical protein